MVSIEEIERLTLEKKVNWLEEELTYLTEINKNLISQVKKDRDRLHFLTTLGDKVEE